MESLSWGLPKINVAPLTSGTLAWVTEFSPVENSTKLTPSQGKELKAPIEGGELEAYKSGKNTYVFEYEIRLAKGRDMKIPDNDGQVATEYSVQLIPEDKTVQGFIIDAASVRVEPTFDTENGAKKKFIFNVLKPATGDAVKWGVQTDKVPASE